MMRDISQELAARIHERKCPLAVVYGPEPTSTGTTTFGRERIVVERLNDRNEVTAQAHSQRRNPKQYWVRRLNGRVTIYAQDTKPGARHFDHEDRMDRIADMVLVCLAEVLDERHNTYVIADCVKFVPADLAATTIHGGAVYRIDFAVSRGVNARDWDGSALPETTFGPDGVTVNSSTTVHMDRGPAGIHEAACMCGDCTG